jgi:quinol monooxygenase YgiN
MIISHVYIHVKPDQVETFKAAAMDNARGANQEPGVISFEVVQQEDDPTRFVLLEVYRDAEAREAHFQTEHFQKWRKIVPDVIAEPNSAHRYVPVYPAVEKWTKR